MTNEEVKGVIEFSKDEKYTYDEIERNSDGTYTLKNLKLLPKGIEFTPHSNEEKVSNTKREEEIVSKMLNDIGSPKDSIYNKIITPPSQPEALMIDGIEIEKGETEWLLKKEDGEEVGNYKITKEGDSTKPFELTRQPEALECEWCKEFPCTKERVGCLRNIEVLNWEKTMKMIGQISKIHPEIVDEYILLTKNLLSTQRKEHEKEFQDFITQLKKIDNIDNKLREVEQNLSNN